jgi:hyperosmotically inducible protein
MTYSGFFIVFYLAFIFGLAGCQPEGTAEKAGQKIDKAAERTGQTIEKTGEAVAKKAEKAGEYMDDAAITARIKAEILRDPLLNVSEIEVTTTNGVVKLSGTVDSQESIDRAIEIARSLKDVKSVNNALVH